MNNGLGQAGLGQDSSGDFNQLSLQGVDFGDHYDNDEGITPKTNESMTTTSGMEGGMNYQQLGVVPQGLMGNPDFGASDLASRGVPSGMGHYPSQQLGHYQQLGQMDFLTRPMPIMGMMVPGWVLYGALATGAWWAYQQFMR